MPKRVCNHVYMAAGPNLGRSHFQTYLLDLEDLRKVVVGASVGINTVGDIPNILADFPRLASAIKLILLSAQLFSYITFEQDTCHPLAVLENVHNLRIAGIASVALIAILTVIR